VGSAADVEVLQKPRPPGGVGLHVGVLVQAVEVEAVGKVQRADRAAAEDNDDLQSPVRVCSLPLPLCNSHLYLYSQLASDQEGLSQSLP
jgi:hypothetical protein